MASQHESRQGKSGTKEPIQLRRRTNLRPVLEIHWSDVSADSLRLAIDGITRQGAAVMFGRTSDGGALSLCILDGDTKIKEYPHTPEEAQAVILAIVEEYVGL